MRLEIGMWEGTTSDFLCYYVNIPEGADLCWVEIDDDEVDEDINLSELGFEVVKDVEGREVATWIGDSVSGMGQMVYLCIRKFISKLPEGVNVYELEDTPMFCSYRELR